MYTFSATMCRPNSVKWEDVSVILFQKLGAFFLHTYVNTWDARPDIQLPITTKTVVMEQFKSGEKRSKVAIIVLKCNPAAVKGPERNDDEYSISLGDPIVHLIWMQAFIQTPAAVTAASVTKIQQKAFPVSIQITHVDFIAHGGSDSGFAYTMLITMSDGYAGSIIRLERDVNELHATMAKKYPLYAPASFPRCISVTICAFVTLCNFDTILTCTSCHFPPRAHQKTTTSSELKS